MPPTAGVDWGHCPCGGVYETRTVEVKMTVKGQAILLRDVLQGACPNCGSRVYKAATLQRIEETMKGVARDGRLSSAL